MMRWLDFSGAPPLLIARRLLPHWNGGMNPSTGEYLDLNLERPVTDYDYACQAAWPGRSIVRAGTGVALALYTEFDEHTWDAEKKLVACGSWLPGDSDFLGATWSDPVLFEVDESDLILMNSAASGSDALADDDCIHVKLEPGTYIIEYAEISASSVGCFHRFTRKTAAR